jgi:iron complex outermembrane receptor protein
MIISASYRAPETDRPCKALRARLLSCAIAPFALSATSAFAQAQTAPAPAPVDAAAPESASGDIVVTATRREETLSKVPLSIAAYSQQDMDEQGIRGIQDISRLTPALTFSATAGVAGNNSTNIAIRGLRSDVGSSTTAIYLDDTPIQIRNIGYYGGNPYPRIFDLDRVEVLRGPQGTTFGASSEGGAVRFITPTPSLTSTSIYSRAQLSFTDHGAPSYEGGVAVGTPLTDTLGVRGSVWYERVGGYIDQVAQGTDNVTRENVNSQKNIVARVAATWEPAPNLTLTPSIFYQYLRQAGRDDFWEGYGDTQDGDYHSGVAKLEPSSDRLLLPALSAQLKLGNVTLVSNTSYFKREQFQRLNYATYFSFLRSGSPFGTYANKDINNMDTEITVKQRNISQELRAFSFDNALIDWSIGGYYQNSKQDFENLTASGRRPGVLVSGFPQVEGIYSLTDVITSKDSQIAGFANVDLKPAAGLTLTAGIRYTHVKFNFDEVKDGPTNGGRQTRTITKITEGAWTPKFGIKYQVTDDDMLYSSVSKGFRPAGAQPSSLPERCGADLASLGLTATGVPTDFKSDSLWSFEAGSKGKLFGGVINYDASAYAVKWKDIQQAVRLNCGFSFVSNLGDATGKGFEINLEARPASGVSIGGNVGYTKLTYDGDVRQANGVLLRAEDERINGPLWTGRVYGNVETPINTQADGYLRVDYSFASRNTVPSAIGTFGYDPALYALPSTNFVQLRVGIRTAGLDASLFVDNLTNSRDLLARGHDGIGGPLFYHRAFRPRTVGITLQYRR